ncbi:hypothetical protein [Xenorhabdus griffiniae]|uniref:Uncharacterized protein n=1 Tax=Xenorhabdus griffiniae TaxID=351672 RepID=A0ABY9XD44_9GAMM|nr:hypothetical protein [Xenorhabdus griffiniae]MBD1229167.1 hypothetical protein [Xenorhabdus griffiniae]MBE8587807.1 hypothetical protein [Xenorhabdus griffiniae]WMV70834.1 hypothetical protein QL128_11400 [Xenorhabdus griffiniae]WNH00510.1 hypothetical protein QL112_011405 [Xenorhabdus griffiniae]
MAKTITLCGYTFKSIKAAKDYFRNERLTHPYRAPITQGILFERLMELFLFYCNHSEIVWHCTESEVAYFYVANVVVPDNDKKTIEASTKAFWCHFNNGKPDREFSVDMALVFMANYS